MTGKNPWQLEDLCDHYGVFPIKFKVYTDMLEAGGYFVGLTGKGWGPGEFRRWVEAQSGGKEYDAVRLKPPTTGIQTNDYAKEFCGVFEGSAEGSAVLFLVWAREPHRPYELSSGVKAGKKLAEAAVPAYLPDDAIVRSDLLDYAVEIEWFDAQLGKMLKMLEEMGELDDTVVVVTADNGMPFPRVKGHIYEDGCHLPLAIRYPRLMKAGRVVDDLVSVIDFAPAIWNWQR